MAKGKEFEEGLEREIGVGRRKLLHISYTWRG